MHSRIKLSDIFCLTLAFFVMADFVQARQDLLDSRTRDLLHEELSGELAKEHVIEITRHHRIQGSRGYRDAANYVLEQLHSYGFSEEDAYIESFESDGKIYYQTWQSPSGWEIEWGELRMLEPFEERIVGYPEIAMSIITYSNPGDVTADVVWVGSGTSDADYDGKDVAGKFVLATGYGGSVHRLAVLKYGAKAVICYLDDDRAQEHPDMLRYTGMWPKTDELDRVTFGFNLTNRQGEKLRKLLQAGHKVVLQGQVKGIGLESYFMDVVVARIRGSEKPEEELVFSAHLDHPKESANDNASGAAAILDIARSLTMLTDGERLPRPKRSFRFIWVPEWYGTMAYVDKHPELKGPELGGTFLANMNLDMVGENLELLHSKLIMTRTPDSLPSVVNDVVQNMAEMVDKLDIRTPRGSLSAFNYRVTPYSGGSDHMMFIERKIPGMMFSHDPDYTHHTSEDTPDKVDPVELERCELIAAGTMWFLANMTSKDAAQLAFMANANSLKRLAMQGRQFQDLYERALDDDQRGFDLQTEAHTLVRALTHREIKNLKSLLTFNDAPETIKLVEKLHAELRNTSGRLLEIAQSLAKSRGLETLPGDYVRRETDPRIPVRITRGPIDFGLPESRLSDTEKNWYMSPDFRLGSAQRFELVNFIDGRRSVLQIRDALSAEFGPVELGTVSRYLDDLVNVGILKWK